MSWAAEVTGYGVWLLILLRLIGAAVSGIERRTRWWLWHHGTLTWKKEAWQRWVPIRIARYRPPFTPRTICFTIPGWGKAMSIFLHRTSTCKAIAAAQKAERMRRSLKRAGQ